MPKIIVIGAGPAGSIAAIILARAGIDTTLIEQHRFPRDKVCGECLSALGIDVLSRLRLSASLQSHSPIKLIRTIFFESTGRRAEIPLPRPMLGISRRALDQNLLDAARTAGAKILQPARCEKISEHNLRVRNLESNEVQTIEADHIIVADGKASMMPDPPPPTTDMVLKAHFINVNAPTDAIELFTAHGQDRKS